MNAPINMAQFAAQLCCMAQPGRDFVEMPTAPDLTGLYAYEHVTSMGLCLRCYLEHEAAVDGGNDHPSTPAKVWLVYTFAGLVDVLELVELVPGLQAKIESEAMESMKMDKWNVEYDRGEARHLERMECEA